METFTHVRSMAIIIFEINPVGSNCLKLSFNLNSICPCEFSLSYVGLSNVVGKQGRGMLSLCVYVQGLRVRAFEYVCFMNGIQSGSQNERNSTIVQNREEKERIDSGK